MQVARVLVVMLPSALQPQESVCNDIYLMSQKEGRMTIVLSTYREYISTSDLLDDLVCGHIHLSAVRGDLPLLLSGLSIQSAQL